MAHVSNGLWHYLVDSPVGKGNPDPRVADWPLLDDFMAPVAISVAYLVAVFGGIRFMKDRSPMTGFPIKQISLVHNFILFTLSLYMVVETLAASFENFGWAKDFTLFCNPVDPTPFSESPSGKRLATVLWIHYVSKAYEFVDTLIMVAKKNNHQISFLHVYHHATTFFPVWFLNVRYGPGGDAYFCCFLNSLIHVFMYGYYFFASIGIKTPLKKFLTMGQMIQFCLFILQSIWLAYTDCFKPRVAGFQLGFQCTIFLGLFANFYLKSYAKKATGKGSDKTASSSSTKDGKKKKKTEKLT